MDARLTKVTLLAGETFSVTDITALVTVDFVTHAFNMPIPAESIRLRRWYAVVVARPSATA
jgi:glutathione S-transferase